MNLGVIEALNQKSEPLCLSDPGDDWTEVLLGGLQEFLP